MHKGLTVSSVWLFIGLSIPENKKCSWFSGLYYTISV